VLAIYAEQLLGFRKAESCLPPFRRIMPVRRELVIAIAGLRRVLGDEVEAPFRASVPERLDPLPHRRPNRGR